MKSLNNLINILLLAVLMLMVLILTVFSFGLTGAELLQNIEADLYQNTAAGLIFLVIFLLTAWALYPLFKTKSKVATISRDEHGSINITLEALDKMIRGIVREEKGLEIKSTELNSRDSGMEVQMRIAVEENQNIPVLTGRIKDNVRYRLKEITGAEIEKVQILIEGISPGKRKPDFISEPPRDKSVRDKDSREEKEVKKKKADKEIVKGKPEKEDEDEVAEKGEKMEKKSSMDKILDKFRKKESKTGDENKDEDSLKTGDETEREETNKDKGPDKNKLIGERDKEEKEKDKNEKKSEAKNKNEKKEEAKEKDKKDYLKNKNISKKEKGISLENSNKDSSKKNNSRDDETPVNKAKDSKDSKDK